MNKIPSDGKRPFFPSTRNVGNANPAKNKNQVQSFNQIMPSEKSAQNSGRDIEDSVNIDPQTIEFMKFKNEVSKSSPLSREDKIHDLKKNINDGKYEPDYDKIAERMLLDEMG